MSSIVISSFAVLPLFAQQGPAPASPNYSIRTDVRRVVVDVVVTNPEGEPVPGLASKDFSVSEDGDAQKILSFSAHEHDTWQQTLPAGLPANTFINLPREKEQGPLYVLLYDLANCDMDTQLFARQQLVKFINQKPEGTRFAFVALSDGPHLIQGFTADKQLLAAALDINGKTPHMPMVFLYANNYIDDRSSYLSVMHDVADYLEGVPGRKNLIWVSSSFPFALFPPQRPDLVEATRRELTALADSQISIYPVSVNGIAGVDKQTTVLDEIAWETGGQAFYNSNDVAGQLDKATSDGATYYTLSYSSTNKNYDGKLRHIEVKLGRSGYQLSYRRQYYADVDGPTGGQSSGQLLLKQASLKDGLGKSTTAPADTLYTFVRHGMPMSHEILFSAHPQVVGVPKLATPEQMAQLSSEASYFRSRKKHPGPKSIPPVPLQSYAIAYAVPVLQFGHVADSDAGPHTLEFAAAAYDQEGHLLNGSIVHATTQADGKSRYYRALQSFVVPTSAAWISLAVRDVDTGRIGNLEFALPLSPEAPAK
jgi:VWFA-related protein